VAEEAKSKLKACSLRVVRYVPDLVRGEFLNIGLLLHSPDEKFLGCLFTDDFRHVRRFHPQADLDFLRELQQDFEQQIDEHEGDLAGYLRFMEQSFSNMIQLGEARPCLLHDPQSEIQTLFERYVGPRLKGPLALDTRLRIKQRLTAALVRAGVWEHLEKRIPAAPWTHQGDPFAFDFGYRPLQVEGRPNGHVKFVHALSQRRDTALAKVLAYTMEHVRRREPAELTAVVEDPTETPDEATRSTRHILQEAQIALCPIAQLDSFAHSIRGELIIS
jgi:hypothetical protein